MRRWPVWPRMTAKQALAKLRSRATLEQLGADDDFIEAWMASDRKVGDGALADEVRARFEGVPGPVRPRDRRRGPGPHAVPAAGGDAAADGRDAGGRRRAAPRASGIGLRRAAELLDAGLEQMATAYRMSAEIADWLNDWAAPHGIDAVELVGIRPTGVDVGERDRRSAAARPSCASGGRTWRSSPPTTCGSTRASSTTAWSSTPPAMSAAEVYLGASRAAHELVLV